MIEMALKKQCVLEEKECIGCGECDRCDLDPNKICDNCMKCINSDAEYRAIMVDDFELEAEFHGFFRNMLAVGDQLNVHVVFQISCFDNAAVHDLTNFVLSGGRTVKVGD